MVITVNGKKLEILEISKFITVKQMTKYFKIIPIFSK